MHTAPEVVSIIIPTYNRADIVAQAIESARGQNYPNKQIIVVDDGSTDMTPDVVKKFGDVEYVPQKNGGPAAARNTGLKHARANFIATLDSDDCWDKGYLSYAMDCLQRHNAQIFFANWREAEPDGSITCTDYFANVRRMQPYFAQLDQSNDICTEFPTMPAIIPRRTACSILRAGHGPQTCRQRLGEFAFFRRLADASQSGAHRKTGLHLHP